MPIFYGIYIPIKASSGHRKLGNIYFLWNLATETDQSFHESHISTRDIIEQVINHVSILVVGKFRKWRLDISSIQKLPSCSFLLMKFVSLANVERYKITDISIDLSIILRLGNFLEH